MSTQAADILAESTVEELSVKAGEPEWLRQIRRSAIRKFGEMDWPKPDEEEWRRTRLDDISFDRYRFAVSDRGPSISDASKELIEAGGLYLDFPLSGETTTLPEKLRSALERTASELDNRFLAWNLSAWSEGALIYVPDGARIENTIAADFRDPENGELNQPHIVVVLGRNAEVTVAQRFTGGGDTLWNAGLTVVAEDGANMTLATDQHVSEKSAFFQHARIYLGRDAVYNGFEAMTGGRLVKSRTEVFIDGPGADARLNGIYFARGNQHMDIRTVQYHRKPHGSSKALYKGAVAVGGRSVYQGLIDVEHGADGTDAYLTNKNLILGDGARADSIPCLEIRTNDVKCSHGSTSGRINEEELFYLMSRGIPRADAVRDLILGYFEEAIQLAPESERDSFRTKIAELVR